MPIIRITDQERQTLQEFYEELSVTSTNSYVDVGNRMLPILKLIDEMFPNRIIYGLTSVARLVLLAEDNWQSDWLVIIASNGMPEYSLEYLMPTSKAPWPGAVVSGIAQSLEEAREYLEICIRECEGWADY